MKLKYISSFFALPTFVTFALACLGAQAQADVVVLRQHNSIYAIAGPYFNSASDSSDVLTSWKGIVSKTLGSHSASATLSSTIAAGSLTLDSSTNAKAPPRNPYDPFVAFATATTQLQFTVSATRTYHVVGAFKRLSPPVIQLLRDGVVMLSGPFNGDFLFEIGHTYEIDASAQAAAGYRMGTDGSGYRYSMR
jgi:hypothetical protein